MKKYWPKVDNASVRSGGKISEPYETAHPVSEEVINEVFGQDSLTALTTGESGYIHKPTITAPDTENMNFKFNPTLLDRGPIAKCNDPEYKASVLLDLGFRARGLARWYSPILGEDLEENWLYFDLETDDLTSITWKLHKSGYVKGQQNIRFKLKEIIDL